MYPDTDVLERHMDEVVALAEADMLEAETELLQLKEAMAAEVRNRHPYSNPPPCVLYGKVVINVGG